jgi:integrase/recombinase XerD
MELLQAGVDRSMIALWLGHESIETTQIYVDADLALKEKALAKTTPANSKHKRFRAEDSLLAFSRVYELHGTMPGDSLPQGRRTL